MKRTGSLRRVVAWLCGALVLGALATTGRAEPPLALAGWTPIGEVHVDKRGCAPCSATFATARRYRSFGLTSDSPFALALAGRFDVTCADGATYNVLLHSPTTGGIFQLVPNRCVNLDTKKLEVTITSVSLAPADAERSIAIGLYGKL